MLSKKRITKMMNDGFRHSIINSMRIEKLNCYKIPQFARYTVDSCIVHRNVEHENDREWNYGFTPIQCLAAVMKDGSIQKRFFEFNSVNHFLKLKEGEKACEVVQAILVEWAREDSNIVDFDIDRIDAEFQKIEAEYVEKQKLEERTNEIGKKIKETVEPIVNQASENDYDDIVGKVYAEVDAEVQKFKDSGDIVKYVISLDRNTENTKLAGDFFVDIGYKVTNESEYVVLACHVRRSSWNGTVSVPVVSASNS